MSVKKHRRGPRDAQAVPHKNQTGPGGYWIYGRHAVTAALANPERQVSRILVSAQAGERIALPRNLPSPQTVENKELDRLLGEQAVHQGIAALVSPLPGYVIEDVLHIANPTGPLHVGHGRGAAFGASLANVLEAAGYSVDREYYVNDAGRQMDILALSTWLRYLEINGVTSRFPGKLFPGFVC